MSKPTREPERASVTRAWLLPLLVAIAVFVGHVSMLHAYGASWDEPLHRDWGQRFLAYLQTLDDEYLTSMPGSGMYYGPTLYALNWLVSGWLESSIGLMPYEAAHVFNISIFSIASGTLFAVARSWFGTRIAATSVLFFVLFPLLVAHAQYNPKDVPLMAASLPMMFYGVRLMKDSSWRMVAATGFWFGVAFGIKVSAVVMLVVLAMLYLLSVRPLAVRMRADVRTLPAFVGGAVGGALLTWPSLLTHPEYAIGALKLFLSPFWPGHVMYLGQDYLAAELPWHYIPMQFLLGVPLVTLLSACVGIAVSAVAWRRRTTHGVQCLALVCWLVVPLVLSLKPGLVRYDGMRQFFFVVPALIMLAALGLERVSDKIAQLIPTVSHTVPKFASFIVVLWLLIEIARVHPYEGSYVNEAGRIALQPDIGAEIELEIWGASLREGVEWINANAQTNAVVCVPTAPVLLGWYARRADITLGCTENTTHVMFFMRTTVLKEGLIASLPAPVFTVSRYGSDLLRVYTVR